ncbi:iron complex transport system substrate-binding protein [Actinoplanes campanulatus]|uniref:Iron complex transport system substrate-binding protein n=1 Tax=Actinoplanes campanulatus TaxID=113559 RepID=A0A7W5FIL7_9ACTN|nr:ABC transporter substrate-binding protein [Actinoplanes campanulatus]MBB3099863.1 iron complex transport system substrate-binding protein [Actinoplanes campanulatus]GGN47870.1 ABC transporter substrate-binding protein [Actinoplanes campanulatus]GID40422.1 ABC transporter substrate-binding protein [Actinoplanes campanulatus]
MKRLLTAAIAATALFLTGCAGDEPTPATASSSAAGAYPVTVGAVTLAAPPAKIVSLSPTATEMLYAIGAGSQVTAVDDQSTYPADAPKTDLSGFKPNAEAIAAKDPDLVVLSNDSDGIVAQLGKLSIPAFVSPAAATLDDTYREITELGALTGHPAEAKALNERMAADIDKIVKSVPARSKPLSYYYELGPDLYSATSKTFIGSVFNLFGMANVADAADPDGKLGGYPQLAQESLVQANPDTIFLADSKCCQQSPETVKARPGWSSIAAVGKGQIYALDDDIASRWGPRTVDLVKAVGDAVSKVPQ